MLSSWSMIPISDSIRTLNAPWVNRVIILVNVLVFAYMASLAGGISFDTQAVANFINQFAFKPSTLTSNPADAVADIFSSMFMHGGLEHIGGNMLFLWIFGDNIEDRLGKVKYLLFYLACGVAAALTQALFSGGSNAPMLGASGAIGGVLGAYLVLYPQSGIFTIIPPFFRFTIPAFLYLPYWIALQVYAVFTGSQSGVALWAHIGGFIFGAVAAFFLAGPKPSHVPATRFYR